jgi:hypothetical protein
MSDPANSSRWTLRDLPFAGRLAIAAFLLSVGIGYASALVNLHFQTAKPGDALPAKEEVIADYHGKSGVSQFVRLLEAHPSSPFNGQGSMRSSFTFRAGGLVKARKEKARDLQLDLKKSEDAKKIDQAVARDLEGERRALVAWAKMTDRATQEKDYDADRFELTGELGTLPITPRFVMEEDGKRYALVKGIIDSRCVRCHSNTAGGAGSQYPLDRYEDILLYVNQEGPTGKSIEKLALSTHVHLLGFSMLYGLTGLIFALTGWPGFLRVLIAPLPLVAQVVDISFWWLARLPEPQGPMFADSIRFSGMVVAVGLGLQIVLTMYSLFGKFGKVVVTILLVAAGFGVHQLNEKIIVPYLKAEREGLVQTR